MIPLLMLLGLSASADSGLLEETRGVIGRDLARIPGSTAARELSSRGHWAEAAAMWGQLETPTRFEDLCGALHARYDAPLDIIRRDVAALLADMLTHGLVRKEAA